MFEVTLFGGCAGCQLNLKVCLFSCFVRAINLAPGRYIHTYMNMHVGAQLTSFATKYYAYSI